MCGGCTIHGIDCKCVQNFSGERDRLLHFERARFRWKDAIKMDLTYGCDVNYIHLAEDMNQ
jgi:hypothetical protein